MLAELDYKALSFWMHILELLCIVVIGIYSWISNRHKANAEAISKLDDDLRTELNELDDRVIRIEQSVRHLPTHEDMQNLHRRIDLVAQSLKLQEGTLTQVNNNVQLIHTHLLRGRP